MEPEEKEQELSHAMELFHKILYVDLGIREMNEKIKNWYNLSWVEFQKELKKLWKTHLSRSGRTGKCFSKIINPEF